MHKFCIDYLLVRSLLVDVMLVLACCPEMSYTAWFLPST